MRFFSKKNITDRNIFSNNFKEYSNMKYFDSACMSLQPNTIHEKIIEYYNKYPSCSGRSIHKLSDKLSMEIENGRKALSKYFNANSEELIYTKSTTEAINLVAQSGLVKKGILSTTIEHNSNHIPWLNLATREKLKYSRVIVSSDGKLDISLLKEKILSKDYDFLAISSVSNVTGMDVCNDEIISLAKENGMLVLLDGAQSITTHLFNFEKSGVDFFVFSLHKCFGPTGLGGLLVSKDLQSRMNPLLYGGNMIEDCDSSSYRFAYGVSKFEGGLQNYSALYTVSSIVDFLIAQDVNKIRQHCVSLNEYVSVRLLKNSNIKILGSEASEERGSICNFVINGKDASEVSLLLSSMNNIFLRSGYMCCHSWYKENDLPPSIRISFGVHNSLEDCDALVEAINHISNL